MEEDSSDVVKINGEGRAMINKVSRWKKFGEEYIQVQGGSRKEMEKFLVGLKSCEEIINFNELIMRGIGDERKERKYGEKSKVGESGKDESWKEEKDAYKK